MILIDKKKPISALKLVHTLNHTQTNRICDIHNEHVGFIKDLDYTIGKRIYNLQAGLYKVTIDGLMYVIDVYYDLSNGDFLVIKNSSEITLYMAGSTPCPIVPYRISSAESIVSSLDIESVNDAVDVIAIAGKTNYIGSPSLNNPGKIDRITNIKINTKSGDKSDSLNIPLKHTLGSLPNGARDFIVINADQLIVHDVINTSKEILSGGIDWEYKEEYSDDEYYVFFAKYLNVKLNNTNTSIRCSHFESESCDNLLNKSIKKNCIATSYGAHGNGIWIKIAASFLDIHGNKDYGQIMQKWILAQAISSNPIYIEYEITNTINNTILIDEYHVKTWYPNTTITVDGDYGFSVLYKSHKYKFDNSIYAAMLLQDFTYEADKENNTYTLTGWLGTYNGINSTKCIVPKTNIIKIII